MTKVVPVILCGGSGTRLWPLSRAGFPKQFLVLSGNDSGKSLFQESIERLNQLTGVDLAQTLIVTNEEHRFLALDQLREMPNIKATLLLEPQGRNTAPALTLAAYRARQLASGSSNYADPILIITPADQTIKNASAFTRALQDCIRVVESAENAIAILGITPTTPEIGYGYIQRAGNKDQSNAYVVERFVEKPDVKTAQAYLDAGNYLWNSGMFVLRASTWFAALSEFRPDIYESSEKAWTSKTQDGSSGVEFIRPGNEEFKNVQRIY